MTNRSRKVMRPDPQGRISIKTLTRGNTKFSVEETDEGIILRPATARVVELDSRGRISIRMEESDADAFLGEVQPDGSILIRPVHLHANLAGRSVRVHGGRIQVPDGGTGRGEPPRRPDRFCRCGCGTRVGFRKQYAEGHAASLPQAKFPNGRICACGCGEPTARIQNKWKQGHQPQQNLAEAFWARSRPANNGKGCQVWTKAKDQKGYGRLSWQGRGMVGAHRVAWELTHGFDPGDQWVLHHCDNPPCVNPEHLFLGDHEANVADKVSKERQVAGVNHGRAKLSTTQIEEIRRRYVPSSGGGRPDGNKNQLAKEFGVHPKYIYSIWKNRYRTHS